MRAIMGLATLLSLAGCASITTGSSEQIAIATTPAGAKCVLSRQGQVIAIVEPTPGTATVERGSRDILVTCTRQGYGTATQPLHSGLEASTLGNILLGGVIGIGIDAATGANERYPSSASLTLVSTGSGAAAAQQPAVTAATAPATTQQASTQQRVTTNSQDVPFNLYLHGQSYEGTGRLEDGHISGQLQAFGKPIHLSGEIDGQRLSARLTGYLNPDDPWDANCVADGEASPASVEVTIRMQAACSAGNPSVVLHLELPAAAG